MPYQDNPESRGYVELATLDESEPYEVDYTDLYYHPVEKQFLLRTASGCSCWDGEYDEQFFATFQEVRESLLGSGDERRYNPSLKGAEQLLEEAKAALEKLHHDKSNP